jgi:hypothetical protein
VAHLIGLTGTGPETTDLPRLLQLAFSRRQRPHLIEKARVESREHRLFASPKTFPPIGVTGSTSGCRLSLQLVDESLQFKNDVISRSCGPPYLLAGDDVNRTPISGG